MCGITGWVSFKRDLTQHHDTLEAMTHTMLCRGPDAGDIFTSRHGALGHRRLAVIDIDGGAQPMTADTPAGAVALSYSGEVYNFNELRKELSRRGHRFHTSSDTEVVLRGYLEWGEQVAERLNGMFAFAIWDDPNQKLVLIRDRMGVKPLYYFQTTDGILFGSEPKAILANPLADRAVDLQGLRDLVSFTQRPGAAVWCGMNEVVPGGIVTLTPQGFREYRYWTLDTAPHEDDLDTTVENVRALMTDIVNRQVVADVPLCSLLSGGLDSSVVTALAGAKLGERGQRVRSFSVDFAGRENDFVADDLRATTDGPYAWEVAGHVGTDHEAIVLDHADIAAPEVRQAVVAARDTPLTLGDMDTSLYLLFQAIRTHSTVALSGESADEVFGGYRWFHDPQVQAAETFPWMAVFVSGARAQVSDRFNPEITRALDLPTYIKDQYHSAIAEVDAAPGESAHETRMRVLSYLHLTRFVRMLLERKDRVSMAVGLEVRVPFCDHRLVEYLYNTPWAMKTFDGREKSLLRAAHADLLPQSVLERVKAPYPATLDPRYAKALVEQSHDLLARDAQVFDLIDRSWLQGMVEQDTTSMSIDVRNGMERALDLSVWLDLYNPQIRL